MSSLKPTQYWCIGRNFSEHAQELGNPIPEKPLIFLKSGGCTQTGNEIVIPDFCQEVHHELEIVLYLGSGLKPTHWTLGLDLTDRKMQNELKALGQPWELSKSFIGAAVLGPWQILQDEKTLENRDISLDINGLPRQRGNTADMIFAFPKLIQYLSSRFPLAPGDAIFTGTPKGVGPLKSKDKLIAKSGELTVEWSVR